MQRGLPRPSMSNEGDVANPIRWGVHEYLLPLGQITIPLSLAAV